MKALAQNDQGFAYLNRVISILLQTLLQDDIASVSFSNVLNVHIGSFCDLDMLYTFELSKNWANGVNKWPRAHLLKSRFINIFQSEIMIGKKLRQLWRFTIWQFFPFSIVLFVFSWYPHALLNFKVYLTSLYPALSMRLANDLELWFFSLYARW